ncbi:putative reverse transcriptase, RNA-dependent DNA polymerase [Tanacetum coccineum]
MIGNSKLGRVIRWCDRGVEGGRGVVGESGLGSGRRGEEGGVVGSVEGANGGGMVGGDVDVSKGQSVCMGSAGLKVTAVLIDVNAAQSKLVLLENFNENYSKCLRLLKIDYALWEVKKNDATLPKTTVVEGVEKVMPITSAEEKAQRRLEVKARSTLMMGIPNEHQLKFNSIKDAKLLLEAVEKRFGGNAGTKKTQRNLLKQQYENFTVLSSGLLDHTFDCFKNLVVELELLDEKLSQKMLSKVLRSLSLECVQHAISTKCPLKLAQRLAPTNPSDDIEEWIEMTMAMLTDEGRREYRALRNQDNKNKESSRRSVPIETSNSTALVSCDGLGRYDWSDQAEEGPKYALMSYSSSSSDSEVSNDSTCYKSCLETVKLLKSQYDQLLKDFNKSKLMVLGYKIDKFENASKSLNKLIENQIVDNCKKGLGYNVVPPPYAGNFMPLKPDLSFIGLDKFVNEHAIENCKAKSSEEKPKVVKKNNDAPIIEERVSNSEEENGNPQMDLHDQGVIDSGCSRHMTWNMSYLTDYERKVRGMICLLLVGNPKEIKSRRKMYIKNGFFVGYSLNNKAFRVFNSRTRILEENLHIRFSENTPNAVGSGLDWLFDINALTRTINHEPIVAGTWSNSFAGTNASDNAGQDRKETEPSSQDDGFKPSSDDEKKVNEDLRTESESEDQEKDANVNNTNSVNTASDGNSTNNVNTVSLTVNAVGIKVNAVGRKTSIELPVDPNMHALEDYSIFDFSNDEDDGAEADMTNLDTAIQVSPNPTTRIHKDHALDQVIEDFQSATQTRRISKNLEEHWFVSSIQQRTNHKDLQNCLFACFLSQEEPKKVIHVLMDLSWIEAMQEELLQFKLQEVWSLVDLPNGKRAIGTKWVFGNKKDKRGIMIRNKARLVAQGFIQIEEEVYVCQPPGFQDPDFPNRVYKKELCIAFEKLTHEKFQISSMGELTFFLGLQVQQKKDGIFISQDKYDEDGEEVDVHMYRSMIGSLMYLTSSRPDIMFAVCACARYQVNPKVSHLHVVKKIFRYLKGQPKLGLWYLKDYPFDLVAYTYSDYAGASLDRKSTTGDCQFLGCRLISWKCKK